MVTKVPFDLGFEFTPTVFIDDKRWDRGKEKEKNWTGVVNVEVAKGHSIFVGLVICL